MKTHASFVLIVVIAALVGSLSAFWLMPKMNGGVVKETAYQRIIRTNTLKCGYWVFPPATTVNLKTNKIEGFPVDIAEEMAKRLGLKIEWMEEVTFGNMLMGLETNRYDAVCTAALVTAARARHAEFSMPFLFSGTVGIVRADDTRFDGDIGTANDPSYTIAAQDGDSTSEIISRFFPKAKNLMIPSFTNRMEVIENVVTKKADLAFEEAGAMAAYMRSNPRKIKLLNVDNPFRISPWTLVVNKGEHDLIGLFNGALTEMLYDGTVEQIMKKYNPLPGEYYFFSPNLKAK